MRRSHIGAAAIAAALLTTLGAPPAHAIPSADTEMSILDATGGACSNGMVDWTVRPRVTITNTSEEDDTFSEVFYTGKYSLGGGGQIATSDTEIIDDGGMVAGATVEPGTSETYLPTVGIAIPCTARDATLIVKYNLVDGHKLHSGSATFLAASTAVPTGAVGALGLIALVAVGVFARRRSAAGARATVDA